MSKRLDDLFDTLDKKPNLYNALIMSVAAVALAVLLVFLLPAGMLYFVSILLAAYFVALIVLIMRAFIGQLRYNPYSYNTIYYAGFSVFTLFLLGTQVYITVKLIASPEIYGIKDILSILMKSARNYMLVSSPFVFVFALGLLISNLFLLKREGVHLRNVFAIVISVLLVAGIIFLYFADKKLNADPGKAFVSELLLNVYSAFYIYVECMIIGAIAADIIAAVHMPKYDKDFIVILGCGIRKDGTPTPLLRGRIDKAIEFYKNQLELAAKDATFITSGGKGSDECLSESACMRNYLLEQGIPADKIIEENRSTTTFENFKFSKEIIFRRDPNAKIVFSTSKFHVFRSGLYGRRVKTKAVGIGADTKWYYWPNASVREFLGLIIEHRGKQLLIFGSLTAIYTVLTVLVYYL